MRASGWHPLPAEVTAESPLLSHPPHLPAAVQTGRESLPASFLKLGLGKGRKGLALGGRDIVAWPSGGGGSSGGASKGTKQWTCLDSSSFAAQS